MELSASVRSDADEIYAFNFSTKIIINGKSSYGISSSLVLQKKIKTDARFQKRTGNLCIFSWLQLIGRTLIESSHRIWELMDAIKSVNEDWKMAQTNTCCRFWCHPFSTYLNTFLAPNIIVYKNWSTESKIERSEKQRISYLYQLKSFKSNI